MSESKYGEPWRASGYNIKTAIGDVLTAGDQSMMSNFQASRIISCVNAMAGVGDPEELMRSVRAVVWFDWSENDEDAVSAMERIRSALGESDET